MEEMKNDGPVITTPGNSVAIKTGSWRSSRPISLKENCIDCLFCWLYCPDMAVNIADGKMAGFNYDYCKGCGICALECPGKKGKKAIAMQEEEK
ncbi:MAG: 4Fe-4S dicluster-binding protein [Thermodesulfobacteriota bacterium]